MPYTEEQRRKAVEFFEDYDGHGIFSHDFSSKKFEEKVGLPAPWPTHTVKQTIQAIKDRGLGGSVEAAAEEALCFGYEMAEAVLRMALPKSELAAYERRYGHVMGRGSRFWNCLDAIEPKEVVQA